MQPQPVDARDVQPQIHQEKTDVDELYEDNVQRQNALIERCERRFGINPNDVPLKILPS